MACEGVFHIVGPTPQIRPGIDLTFSSFLGSSQQPFIKMNLCQLQAITNLKKFFH